MTTSPAPDRSRFALLVLALFVGWAVQSAAFSREADGPRGTLEQVAIVAGVGVVFVSLWMNHGIVAAGVAVVVFLTVREPVVSNSLAARKLLNELAFIAALGLTALTWSELDRQRFTPIFWVFAAMGGALVVATVWVQATQTSDLLAGDSPLSSAKSWLQRSGQVTVALYSVGGLLGAWQAFRRRTCPRSAAGAAAAVSLLTPALAFGAARLSVGSTLGDLLNGADWPGFGGEFWNWVGQGGYGHAVGDSVPRALEPLVLPLMVVGLWRAVARGYRQKRRGQIPLAWPVAFGASAALLLVPLAVPATRSLTLAFAIAVLPVFGAADLLQAVADRMVLRGPDEPR